MENLKEVLDRVCDNQIIIRIVREKCKNNPWSDPGVLWIRVQDVLSKFRCFDSGIVFYMASNYLGEDGTELVPTFKVCPVKEFRRVPCFDEISLWNIPGTRFIGELTEEEVDELLKVRVAEQAWDWSELPLLLLGCRVVSQPGFSDEDMETTFIEHYMGLLSWDPEEDLPDSYPEKRNKLWNRISYYQAAVQLLKEGST